MNSQNSANSTSMMPEKCVEEKGKGKAVAPPHSSMASSCDPLLQNHLNFKRSSCPERFMFYENGSWVDYPEEVAEVLKLGFMEGKPMVEAQVQGFNCLFDFYRMLETELKAGNQRSISWIDVDGKCFFPKVSVNSYEVENEDDLVNCYENCPKIQINLRISDKSGSSEGLELNRRINLSKRKRDENVENEKGEGRLPNSNGKCPKFEIKLKVNENSAEGLELNKINENVEKEKMEVSSSKSNTKRLQMVGNESQSSRWPKARFLGAEEKGYAIVKNLFLSGLEIMEPRVIVTAIHQYVRRGPLDKARIQVFANQAEITRRARGESNVVFAWYGTSAGDVESILMHGFGMPSKVSHSGGHGIGIYLSPVRSPQNSAKLSNIDENGEKHVVLCRVILGKCETAEAGSQQSYPSSVEYDTGVDDLKNPKFYTVWPANMNTHVLPECVVSYRPVNMHGSANGISNMNWVSNSSIFVAKLFSKLGSFLPPPKFQELQTLWRSCKEGKLGKDTFMNHLRSIVGDDALRATILEVRG